MSQWGPELIAQEYEAKQTARILLFVIDNQTRNTAGVIEAAQLAATRSESLVLVIYPYRQGQTILGESVSTQYVPIIINRSNLLSIVMSFLISSVHILFLENIMI